MPLSNPSTAFDKDGWADVISDIRKLYLMIEGGSNDMNGGTVDVTQKPDEVRLREVRVCVDGIEKTMKVMGTEPV